MRKRLLLVAVAAATVIGLAGCASKAPQPGQTSSTTEATTSPRQTGTPETVACPATPLDVSITYELKDDGAGGVIVSVSTNLPEGTDLQASFYSPTTRFLAQDPQTVADGKATFGPFADHGQPLHGAYDFSVTAPIARNQPPPVQNCIGSAAENPSARSSNEKKSPATTTHP